MYGNFFKFSELVKTEQNVDNTPTIDTHLANLAVLWNTLNYLRQEFGRPIIVNSAYRTEEVNNLVGGRPKSKHRLGRAADITCEPLFFEQLWNILCSYKKEYGLSELIKYSNFIHFAI